MSKELDSMVSAFETTLLKAMGELDTVKRAIKAKDLATVVKASSRALLRSSLPDKLHRAAELKSADISNKFRKQGNHYYIQKAYSRAWNYYLKALQFAPPNSTELKLAYSNISAVMIAKKQYKAARLNIEAVLDSGCPDFLRDKLERRCEEADNYIAAEIQQEMSYIDIDVIEFLKFDVRRNPHIPCASSAVTVVGRRVMAAEDIRAGTMVAFERAFCSNTDKTYLLTTCYYCHRSSNFLMPCDGCTKAMFCSKECKDTCLEEYHRIECLITGYLYIELSDVNQEYNKLAVKAAIKMSLMMGWDRLRVASLEMGEKLWRNSSVSEAFDCANPTSMLCYNDHKTVATNVIINKALFCATALYFMERATNYWPREKAQREQAIDSLARIIVHLNTTFMRRVPITMLTKDLAKDQTNVGWFSFTSKVQHSCEPNVLVLGFGEHVALIAAQRIRKGDDLTISYIDHFYDMNLVPSLRSTYVRQKLLLRELDYRCECRVCLLEWGSQSHVQGTLTRKQQAAVDRLENDLKGTSLWKDRLKAVTAALDELTGLNNTTQHQNAYKTLLATIGICPMIRNLDKRHRSEFVTLLD